MHAQTQPAQPSARMAAALNDAAQRAELARESGDTAGAWYANAERRAIIRRIRRMAER